MNDAPFWVKEGTQYMMEGDSDIRNIRVTTKSGSAPTITAPLMYVYKNGTDATSTFTTGSMVAAGDIITTKTFTNLIGGDQLHVVIKCTVDGVGPLTVAEFDLIVRRLSGK